MHYSEYPGDPEFPRAPDPEWRIMLLGIAWCTGHMLLRLAPGGIILYAILRWWNGIGLVDEIGASIPWRFFVYGIIIVVIWVIVMACKIVLGDRGYEEQCDHIGVRNGKPCIRPYGHSGQHRYR